MNAMFMALDMPADMKAEPVLTKRLYADALAGLPEEITRKTLRRYRVGSLGDGKWCPKPGELRKAIESAVASEARSRRHVDLAETTLRERRETEARRRARTPEERERVAKMVGDYRAHLDAVLGSDGRASRREPTQDEAREWLEAHEGHVVSVEFSETLRERLEHFARDAETTR